MAEGQADMLPATERPEKVEQIPGVGPIRARCLRKAGYDSIDSLRAASPEALAVVPGITDVKAHQIHAFIQALPPAGAADTPTPPAAAGAKRGRPPAYATALSRDGEGAPQAAGAGKPAAGVAPRSALEIAAVKVAGAAGWLLQSPQADVFARDLARQISKLMAAVGRIADGAPVAEDQQERALRLLERCACALDDVPATARAGAAKQAKLARRIRSSRRKLRKTLTADAGQ